MDEALAGVGREAAGGWEADAQDAERCDRERCDRKRMAASVDAAIRLAQVVSGRFPQAALGGLAGDLREVRAYIERSLWRQGAA